jgi:hypothetical protein
MTLALGLSELRFCSRMDSEFGYDFGSILVGGAEVWKRSGGSGEWEEVVVDLAAFTPDPGQAADITFQFASDGGVSGTLGWQVDNVRLYSGAPDCNGNEIPDDCDVTSGSSLDEDANGIPDECDCLVASDPPEPEAPIAAKNRYLSFVPANSGAQTALRVTAVELPPQFGAIEGAMWAGSPHQIAEESGSSGATGETFMGATLSCEPVYADWGGIGLIHIYGAAIVPGAAYEVQAISESCDPDLGVGLSAPLAVITGSWGDVVGDCSATPCTAPNGECNFDDISAVVDKFKNLPGAPIKARVDIAPQLPDRVIDFVDISTLVDAFRGIPYPFDLPDPCL